MSASPHKSRHEIEKDVSEHKFYQNNNQIFSGNYDFPMFIAGIPLMDFGQLENQHDHMPNKSGDVPIDINESEYNEIERKIIKFRNEKLN